MSNDIMTIKEVLEYLKLKEKTAYALATRGDIPALKWVGHSVFVVAILKNGLNGKRQRNAHEQRTN